MQARAILEAACQLNKEGLKVVPEIMIPLVGHVKELRDQKAIVDRVAAEVMKEQGIKVKYLVGTMIEVPRGALTADEMATEAAVLLLRHQRPHADDLRLLARRRRQVPARLPGQEDPRQGSVRDASTARASGSSWRWPCSKGRADAARTSSWASAASTAATRRRCTSSTRSGLDYVSCSPVPRAGGAPGGGAGGAAGQGRRLAASGPGLGIARHDSILRPREAAAPRGRRDRPRVAASPAAASACGRTWPSRRRPTAVVLREVFGIHELAVEDALGATHHPKIESYGDLSLPGAARHQLPRQRARLRHPRHRLLPGQPLPGHRARRPAPQHRARRRPLRPRAATSWPRARGAAAPHRRHDGRPLPSRGRRARRRGSTTSRAPGPRESAPGR